MDALETARADVEAFFSKVAPMLNESDYSVTRQVYGAAQRCGLEVTSEDPPEIRYTATNTDEVEALLARASDDPVAFDALSIIAADLVRWGETLSQPLADWTADVLAGGLTRPRRKVSKTQSRDHMICIAVMRAVEAGLGRSRNDTTEGGSAFDVVADCLIRQGIPASYDGVKKVWERRTK